MIISSSIISLSQFFDFNFLSLKNAKENKQIAIIIQMTAPTIREIEKMDMLFIFIAGVS